MYTLSAPVIPLSPTTPQASVASMIAPGNPALGRLPVTVVSSKASDAAVQNNVYGHAAYGRAIAPETAAAAPAAPAFEMPEEAPPLRGRINGFPVLFLAQLLGQGLDAEAQSLITSYETLLAYSEVKYQPSGAGKPSDSTGGPMAEFFKSMGAGGANANSPPAVPANGNQAAARQQAREAPPTPPIVAGNGKASSIFSTFSRAKGAEAYGMALARNAVAFKSSAPQMPVEETPEIEAE